MTEDPSTSVETSRRAVLGGLGATISGFGLGEELFGDSSGADADGIVLRQGDRCLPVTPISGDQPVEDFYGYYIPDQYDSEENGGSATGGGPPYSSLGTAYLQKPNGSILFCYDGPEGLSLVVVHGSTANSSSGGAATFAFDGMPADGTWAVKDDLYRNSDTGEIAASNDDRWNIEGRSQTVDWTWTDSRTDGGAFRGLGDDFSVTIDPSFNREAALYGEPYTGTLDSWELLVPEGNGVDRTPLDMSQPVTIETGTCGDSPAAPSAPSVADVEFNGCGEVWLVFEDSFEGTTTVQVETTAGQPEVEVAGSALQLVPGQFGRRPLFRWRGRGKVLGVELGDGTRVRNPNDCAADDEDSDDDDDRNGRGDDDGDDDEEDDDDESENEREREGEYEEDEEDDGDEEEEDDGDDDGEDDEEDGSRGPPWRDDGGRGRPGTGGPPDNGRSGSGGPPGRGSPFERDDD